VVNKAQSLFGVFFGDICVFTNSLPIMEYFASHYPPS
jgi:hypothetical protein